MAVDGYNENINIDRNEIGKKRKKQKKKMIKKEVQNLFLCFTEIAIT